MSSSSPVVVRWTDGWCRCGVVNASKMSPEKKVADEEGSPKKDSTKRHEEVTGNDNNHNEDDVASDISSNSSLGFEDDEDDSAKNKTGVNRIVPDYASDVSSDDLSGKTIA